MRFEGFAYSISKGLIADTFFHSILSGRPLNKCPSSWFCWSCSPSGVNRGSLGVRGWLLVVRRLDRSCWFGDFHVSSPGPGMSQECWYFYEWGGMGRSWQWDTVNWETSPWDWMRSCILGGCLSLRGSTVYRSKMSFWHAFEEREMMEFLLGVIGVVNPLLDIPSGKVSKNMGVNWPGMGEISLSWKYSGDNDLQSECDKNNRVSSEENDEWSELWHTGRNQRCLSTDRVSSLVIFL